MKQSVKHILETFTNLGKILSIIRKQEEVMNTILGKNTKIEGNMEVVKSVRINGTFKGLLTAKDTLIVGSAGELSDVTIKVKNAINKGSIKGNITASDKITLEGTSRLEGDITTKLLIVKENASFSGNCKCGEYFDSKKQFRKSKFFGLS